MTESITIGRRFNGPEELANGGYACGIVAELIDGTAEVTLRTPPPLQTPLRVERGEGGFAALFDGETMVAEGHPIAFEPAKMPSPPSWTEAEGASRGYLGFERHEFPTCFTCGPARTDGLGIFAGPATAELVAAPWVPDTSLPNDDGVVAEPIVWAALDCPGAWVGARNATVNPVVLGRMAAAVSQPVEIGRRYVVMACKLGDEGRKSFAATALVNDGGTTVATARQTWITLT